MRCKHDSPTIKIDHMKYIFKSSIRNIEKDDIEICQSEITLKLIFLV